MRDVRDDGKRRKQYKENMKVRSWYFGIGVGVWGDEKRSSLWSQLAPSFDDLISL